MLRILNICCILSVFLQLPRPQRFPSSYLSRVETLVETVSEHIFWKNKDLQEETRSANLAVAAFVKVGWLTDAVGPSCNVTVQLTGM